MRNSMLPVLVAALLSTSAYAVDLGVIDPNPMAVGGFAAVVGTGDFKEDFTFELATTADIIGSVTIATSNSAQYAPGAWTLFSGAPGSGAVIDSELVKLLTGFPFYAYFASVSDPGPQQLSPGHYYFELTGKAAASIAPAVSYSAVDGATAPEAPTWAMMGLGFLGLGFAGRRAQSRRRIEMDWLSDV